MSTGLLNPYIRLEPEFLYPQKYYLIHDLVGNVIHTSNTSNIYSNINPFPDSNVGQVGIIRCEPPANSVYQMIFKTPNEQLINNTFSIQFYMHASSNSVQINTASLSMRIQPTTNILFRYNTTVSLPEMRVQSVMLNRTWNHYMFSMNRANLFVFVNGTGVYNSSSLTPFSGSFSNLEITTTTSNTVLLSDIKITKEINSINFAPEKAPFKITSNTHALITGEFNPLVHTKTFSNVLTINPPVPDIHSFRQAINGTAWWYGWIKSNTQSNTNFLRVGVPTFRNFLTFVIGNTNGSRQSQTFTTSTLTTFTFNSQSNSYVPFYAYASNISGSVASCTLNGKNLLWSDISPVQLTNRFKLYSGGLVLEGDPPAFGRTFRNDILLTPVNVGESNIITASNIGLSNGTGGYLGYNGTFLMSPVSSLISNIANLSYTWNFTPDGRLSNSTNFITNAYIENI